MFLMESMISSLETSIIDINRVECRVGSMGWKIEYKYLTKPFIVGYLMRVDPCLDSYTYTKRA